MAKVLLSYLTTGGVLAWCNNPLANTDRKENRSAQLPSQPDRF